MSSKVLKFEAAVLRLLYPAAQEPPPADEISLQYELPDLEYGSREREEPECRSDASDTDGGDMDEGEKPDERSLGRAQRKRLKRRKLLQTKQQQPDPQDGGRKFIGPRLPGGLPGESGLGEPVDGSVVPVAPTLCDKDQDTRDASPAGLEMPVTSRTQRRRLAKKQKGGHDGRPHSKCASSAFTVEVVGEGVVVKKMTG